MSKNKRTGREIRPRNGLQQILIAQFVILDKHLRRIYQFAKIMRRHIGCHTNGNAISTIDQQIGEARGQHHRLTFRIIVIVLKIDRVLVDILEQGLRRFRHTNFGVTHGGRRIAID